MTLWTKTKTAARLLAAMAVVSFPWTEMSVRGQESEDKVRVDPAEGAAHQETAEQEQKPLTVIPRTYDAWRVFDDDLPRKGRRAFSLGPRAKLLIPPEMRFRPVEVRELVEAVAKRRGLSVLWLGRNDRAILYLPASSGEIARLKKDLQAREVPPRREGAWRGRWLHDPQAVPALVSAAADADSETARVARESLRRLGWDAVLTLDEQAWDLVPAGLAHTRNWVRVGAVEALGRVGGKKALTLLEKALNDRRYTEEHIKVAPRAVLALRHVGEAEVPALLEKALKDDNADMHAFAVFALGSIGGEKALVLLKKALRSAQADMRRHAASALGSIGGQKARDALLAAIEVEKDNDNYREIHSVLTKPFGGNPKVQAALKKLPTPALEPTGK